MFKTKNLFFSVSTISLLVLAGCNSNDKEYIDREVDREIADSIDTGPYACSSEEIDDNPGKDCRLYIKGSMNSWSARPDAQLHYQGEGAHIALFSMESGSYSFKISDPQWSDQRDLAIAQSADNSVSVDTIYELQRKYDEFENQNMDIVVNGQEQVFRFTLDASVSTDNPTLYIENITEQDVDNLSTPMYLVGSFTDWEQHDDYVFKYIGAGNYQVKVSFAQQTDIQFNITQELDDKLLTYGSLKNQLVDLKEGASALTTYPGGLIHASVEAGSYIVGISVLGDGQIGVPVSIAKVNAVSGYNKLTTIDNPISIGADGSTFAQSYEWETSSDDAVNVSLEDDDKQLDSTSRQIATADEQGNYKVTLTINKELDSQSTDSHDVDVVSMEKTKNVILMIGDGMGYGQINVTRAYKGETLFLESGIHQGQINTASADTLGHEHLAGLGEHYYTDSAAAASAMATGYKVNSGVISQAIPGDGSDLKTILESAQKMGKSVGVVATSHCVHATPAAFTAHGQNRNDFTQLSQSMFYDVQPNVALCGSKQVDNIDVISRDAAANNYIVVRNHTDLMTKMDDLPINDPNAEIKFAGIFGIDEIPYVVPSDSQEANDWSYESLDIPQIERMTEIAIDILSRNPNGFFLMVEGSQIDFAAHINDEKRMIHETLKFDDSVKHAVDWSVQRDDTMVIVTADHETGGLALIKTNGAGNIPDVSWKWGSHTNVPVPMMAWGLNSDVVHARSIDNTSIHSIMFGAMTAAQ
ncbi:hypothetical protein GCM10007916_34450 [Psychromonas marina]|uniref:Alkaline phosphatase n=1 Tax=Psychromonas marina TaxID=88364 RepID=A0ABQ6E4N7_9GAMM|nr:alkaline phosphatase [Psychromonas marina]GLS92374.1 hypothetical protein GCM10007916_34450 [Psychromonas marina]